MAKRRSNMAVGDNLIIQHEYYQEVLRPRPGVRDVEADAEAADAVEEKEC